MATKRYQVYVKCGNCGYEGEVIILQGILVGYQDCPACGCKELKYKEQSKKFKPSK